MLLQSTGLASKSFGKCTLLLMWLANMPYLHVFHQAKREGVFVGYTVNAAVYG